MLISSLATSPRSGSNLRGAFFMFEAMLHRYKNLVNMESEGRISCHCQSVKPLRATTGTVSAESSP